MCTSTRLVILAAVAGLAATFGLLWLTDVPLGVPGEWTWARIAYSSEHVWGWIIALIGAVAYIGFVAIGADAMDSHRGWLRTTVVSALAVAGFGWLVCIQLAVPGSSGLQKTHFVLYFRGSSGYFWQARYEVDDTREFLGGYEELLAEQDYLHIGTHPPGLTLLFRGLLNLLDASPGLTEAVLTTEPASVREAATTIRGDERLSGRELRRVDEAVLWLAAVLAMAAAAATVVPLYTLLADCVARQTAWFAAAMWPLVPGIAVFLPKSDAVFPLISMLGPCLWLAGWRKRSLVCCCLAGLTLFGGMLLSLAIAPIAALTALATVLTEWKSRHSIESTLHPSPRPSADAASTPATSRGGAGEVEQRSSTWIWWLLSASAAGIGFFVPVIFLRLCCDLNLPRVWTWNASNHALFYEHNVRTWWKWLLVNPIEAGLAAGGPLALLGMCGAIRSRTTRLFPLVAGTLIVWGLLWISGKNMGEAARLWLLFQPWMVVAVAGAIGNGRAADVESAVRRTANSSAAPRPVWIAVLSIQAIACIATVTRVDGFAFNPL